GLVLHHRPRDPAHHVDPEHLLPEPGGRSVPVGSGGVRVRGPFGVRYMAHFAIGPVWRAGLCRGSGADLSGPAEHVPRDSLAARWQAALSGERIDLLFIANFAIQRELIFTSARPEPGG